MSEIFGGRGVVALLRMPPVLSGLVVALLRMPPVLSGRRRTPPHATCVVLLSSHSSACHLCCLVFVALLRMPPVLSCLVVALLRMPPVLPCLVVNLRCESRGGRGEKEREGKRAERGRRENLEGCMPDLTSLTLTSMLCREGSSPSQEVPTYGLLT